MATDVPQLAGAASTRRAPTQQEREIAQGIFAREGVSGKVAVQNLTAGDLDNDSSHELVTISHHYEWRRYKACSQLGGKWRMVYEGHGGGS